MAAVECSHVDAPTYGRVCFHLLATTDTAYSQRFTGTDLEYDFVCSECLNNLERLESYLRHVCRECFDRIADDCDVENIVGRPRVRQRPTNMHFRHERVGHLEGWPRNAPPVRVASDTGAYNHIAVGEAGNQYWQFPYCTAPLSGTWTLVSASCTIPIFTPSAIITVPSGS